MESLLDTTSSYCGELLGVAPRHVLEGVSASWTQLRMIMQLPLLELICVLTYFNLCCQSYCLLSSVFSGVGLWLSFPSPHRHIVLFLFFCFFTFSDYYCGPFSCYFITLLPLHIFSLVPQYCVSLSWFLDRSLVSYSLLLQSSSQASAFSTRKKQKLWKKT